jgi:hypothetical protein
MSGSRRLQHHAPSFGEGELLPRTFEFTQVDAHVRHILWWTLGSSDKSHSVPLLIHQDGMEFYSQRAYGNWILYCYGQDSEGL